MRARRRPYPGVFVTQTEPIVCTLVPCGHRGKLCVLVQKIKKKKPCLHDWQACSYACGQAAFKMFSGGGFFFFFNFPRPIHELKQYTGYRNGRIEDEQPCSVPYPFEIIRFTNRPTVFQIAPNDDERSICFRFLAREIVLLLLLLLFGVLRTWLMRICPSSVRIVCDRQYVIRIKQSDRFVFLRGRLPLWRSGWPRGVWTQRTKFKEENVCRGLCAIFIQNNCRTK